MKIIPSMFIAVIIILTSFSKLSMQHQGYHIVILGSSLASTSFSKELRSHLIVVKKWRPRYHVYANFLRPTTPYNGKLVSRCSRFVIFFPPIVQISNMNIHKQIKTINDVSIWIFVCIFSLQNFSHKSIKFVVVLFDEHFCVDANYAKFVHSIFLSLLHLKRKFSKLLIV